MSLYALQRQQMTVRILAHDQERARDAILEAFALNEDQLAPATVPVPICSVVAPCHPGAALRD